MSSSRLARLSEVTGSYIERGKLAGTVTLVARRGKVVHFEALGSRCAEQNQPMERDTMFRLASMTNRSTL